MPPITRRAAAAGFVAAPMLLAFGRAGALGPDRLFTFGVASGEPGADGMVLWTRLAPRPMQADGGMPASAVPVRWEIYADDTARTPIRAGYAIADPAWGHSVHVEISGLAPDRPYWFRFFAHGEASAVGRTRTAPAAGAIASRLRFCFGSCQKYEVGRYGAWANAVADDPDLILFLGDYIYEAKPNPTTLRPHLNPEPVDVGGYRVRYATYRLDPQLQAAHAIAPWIVTWDDHEVVNDYANLADQFNTDPAVTRRRRAAAYQVYWEFMPLRRTARPIGAAMRLYRTIDWGALAAFHVVDDRQYRAPRACQPPELAAAHREYRQLIDDCADRRDAHRSMLGAAQDRWLDRSLAHSRTRWNILAQQTAMTPYPQLDPARPEGTPSLYSADGWDGYPASRDRILARLQASRVSNPVVVGGDIHAFVASDLRRGDTTIAPCFVGGSITSLAGDKLMARNTGFSDAYHFADNSVRGYARIDLTRDRCDVTFRGIADPRDPDTAAYDLRRFTVENARPTMQSA